MAKQFRMPESLDVSYKFFNGRFSFKEIAVRLIGLPPALAIGFLSYGLSNNKFFGILNGLIVLGFGVWVGSKKVFNKSISLLSAIQYSNELNKKSKRLYNYRDYEGTTIKVKEVIQEDNKDNGKNKKKKS